MPFKSPYDTYSSFLETLAQPIYKSLYTVSELQDRLGDVYKTELG